jgi:hypothetical protein
MYSANEFLAETAARQRKMKKIFYFGQCAKRKMGIAHRRF